MLRLCDEWEYIHTHEVYAHSWGFPVRLPPTSFSFGAPECTRRIEQGLTTVSRNESSCKKEDCMYVVD